MLINMFNKTLSTQYAFLHQNQLDVQLVLSYWLGSKVPSGGKIGEIGLQIVSPLLIKEQDNFQKINGDNFLYTTICNTILIQFFFFFFFFRIFLWKS